jgi:hypothetical protein
MVRLVGLLLVVLALSALRWETAAAVEPVSTDAAAVSLSRSAPDPPVAGIDLPGETTVRVPLGSESDRLPRLLSPYVSLGSSTAPGVPWNSTLPSSLRSDVDGPDTDLRLGAGLALPLSSRARIYAEYQFLRGRLESGVGRGLLQREPDSADFRAGFSIRLK